MRKIPRRSSSTSKRAQKDSKHKGWTSCPAPGSNWWPSGYESDALTNWASRARAYIWWCQKEILTWLWKLGVILASLDKWPPGNKIWLDGLLGAVDENQTPDTKNSKSGTFSAFLPSSNLSRRCPGSGMSMSTLAIMLELNNCGTTTTTSNKRSCSKKWTTSGQNCVFPVFPAKNLARFCHAVLDFRE